MVQRLQQRIHVASGALVQDAEKLADFAAFNIAAQHTRTSRRVGDGSKGGHPQQHVHPAASNKDERSPGLGSSEVHHVQTHRDLVVHDVLREELVRQHVAKTAIDVGSRRKPMRLSI